MIGLTARDERYLLRAIELAHSGVDDGNRPFGAILVDANDLVVAEGWSTQRQTHDWTAHAELNVLREAGKRRSYDELAGCTLYASGEPCPMCAAAMHWCNVQRLVFGIDEVTMREYRDTNEKGAGIPLSARDVLYRSSKRIEVIGPALVAAARLPHDRYWQRA